MATMASDVREASEASVDLSDFSTAPSSAGSSGRNSTDTIRTDVSTDEPQSAESTPSLGEARTKTHSAEPRTTDPKASSEEYTSPGAHAKKNPHYLGQWPSSNTRAVVEKKPKSMDTRDAAITERVDASRPMLSLVCPYPNVIDIRRHAPVTQEVVDRLFPGVLDSPSSALSEDLTSARVSEETETAANGSATSAPATAGLATDQLLFATSCQTDASDPKPASEGDGHWLADYQLGNREIIWPTQAVECEERLRTKVDTAYNYLTLRHLGPSANNDRRSFTASYRDLAGEMVPEDMRLTQPELNTYTDLSLEPAGLTVQNEQRQKYYVTGLTFQQLMELDQTHKATNRSGSKTEQDGSFFHPDLVLTDTVRSAVEGEVGCRAATWAIYARSKNLDASRCALVTGRLLNNELGDMLKSLPEVGDNIGQRADYFSEYWQSRAQKGPDGETLWPDETVEQCWQDFQTHLKEKPFVLKEAKAKSSAPAPRGPPGTIDLATAKKLVEMGLLQIQQ